MSSPSDSGAIPSMAELRRRLEELRQEHRDLDVALQAPRVGRRDLVLELGDAAPEIVEQVRRLLDSLPDDQRAALVLFEAAPGLAPGSEHGARPLDEIFRLREANRMSRLRVCGTPSPTSSSTSSTRWPGIRAGRAAIRSAVRPDRPGWNTFGSVNAPMCRSGSRSSR